MSELDEPIDIGDEFCWRDVETWSGDPQIVVLNMYISEDGETQVRIKENGDKHTLTPEDLMEPLLSGELVRYEDHDPPTEERL